MVRAQADERVRLLALELVAIQNDIEELEEEAEGLVRARLRRIGDRLRGARSRLTVTIEEDRV